jgi:hypothetical protein
LSNATGGLLSSGPLPWGDSHNIKKKKKKGRCLEQELGKGCTREDIITKNLLYGKSARVHISFLFVLGDDQAKLLLLLVIKERRDGAVLLISVSFFRPRWNVIWNNNLNNNQLGH